MQQSTPVPPTPFITAYGESPLVVCTEFCAGGRVRASIVRPRNLHQLAMGRSWSEAHWELFNVLLGEYMNLDRNRSQLGPGHMGRLFELDCLKEDGTLKLIATIARSGFPAGLHDGTQTAPVRIELPG